MGGGGVTPNLVIHRPAVAEAQEAKKVTVTAVGHAVD